MDGIHIVAFAEEEDPGLCFRAFCPQLCLFLFSLSTWRWAQVSLFCCPQMAMSSWRSWRTWPETTPITLSSVLSGLILMTSLWFCFLTSNHNCILTKTIFLSNVKYVSGSVEWNRLMLSLQLTTYWEKTFKLDLFRPQIGVVNVTDVSSAKNTRSSQSEKFTDLNLLGPLCCRQTVYGWTCPTTKTCPLQRNWRTG